MRGFRVPTPYRGDRTRTCNPGFWSRLWPEQLEAELESHGGFDDEKMDARSRRLRRRGPTGGSARRLAGNAPTTADAPASSPSTRRRRCSPSLSARSNMRLSKAARRQDCCGHGERTMAAEHGCSNADSRSASASRPPMTSSRRRRPSQMSSPKSTCSPSAGGNNATTVQGRSGGGPPPSTHWRRSRAPGAKARCTVARRANLLASRVLLLGVPRCCR